MTLKSLLLSSALSGSLALTPLALQAQDYDAWALDREVLNSAANYTGVLTAAHGQVRKYITWDWSTSLSEDEQRQRTTDLLHEITSRQQITRVLVPSLNMDGVNSYDVRFRWCDNRLLSYFANVGFKHGFSGQQIIDAPMLRAQRNGRTFTGEPLGLVESDDTGDGALRLQTYGGRSTPIPVCMADDYGGVLPEGTVAYMTSAAQKFGVARTRREREVRKLPCEGGQVGPGIKQERYLSTDYNAQGDRLQNAQGAPGEYPYYDINTPDGDGHWRVRYSRTGRTSHCRTPATISVRRVEACRARSDGSLNDGTATWEYFLTEAYDPAFAGTPDFAKTVWRPSDRDGNFTPGPVGHLVAYLSFCGDQTPDSLTLVPETSRREETRPGQCRAPYRLGAVTQAREVEVRRWSFAGSPDVVGFPALSTVVTEIEGPWRVTKDLCYRNVNQPTPKTETERCTSGSSGIGVLYRWTETETGTDWRDPKWQDDLKTESTPRVLVKNNCRPNPLPPYPPPNNPPSPDGSGGGGSGGGGGNRGGGREESEHHYEGSDGRKYDTWAAADSAGVSSGGYNQNGPCNCNGQQGGNSDSNSGSKKGGSGGGCRGWFCFAHGTGVEMADGTVRAIETLKIGDTIRGGGRVRLITQSRSADLRDLGGIHVTARHWVRHKNRWIEARHHPDARPVRSGPVPVCNLATEGGVIRCGGHVFADLLTMRPALSEELRRMTGDIAFARKKEVA